MVINNSSSIINFDRGIGRIATQRMENAAPALTKIKLSPTEVSTAGMVDRLRSAPTMEHQARMAAMPSVSDRALLSQAQFEAALRDADGALDLDSNNPVIKDMRTVLQGHQDLQDALKYYCDLLLAG